MNAEKIIKDAQINYKPPINPRTSEKKLSTRVDINHLLTRVRENRKKENKLNLVFFGLFLMVISVIGTMLSF